jgi:hypothetical protein
VWGEFRLAQRSEARRPVVQSRSAKKFSFTLEEKKSRAKSKMRRKLFWEQRAKRARRGERQFRSQKVRAKFRISTKANFKIAILLVYGRINKIN